MKTEKYWKRKNPKFPKKNFTTQNFKTTFWAFACFLRVKLWKENIIQNIIWISWILLEKVELRISDLFKKKSCIYKMLFIKILQYKNVQSILKFKFCLAVEISEFFHFSAKSVGNILDVVSKLVGPLVLFPGFKPFTVRCVVTNHSFPRRLQLFHRLTRVVLVVTKSFVLTLDYGDGSIRIHLFLNHMRIRTGVYFWKVLKYWQKLK